MDRVTTSLRGQGPGRRPNDVTVTTQASAKAPPSEFMAMDGKCRKGLHHFVVVRFPAVCKTLHFDSPDCLEPTLFG
jgi:hypothetical protein